MKALRLKVSICRVPIHMTDMCPVARPAQVLCRICCRRSITTADAPAQKRPRWWGRVGMWCLHTWQCIQVGLEAGAGAVAFTQQQHCKLLQLQSNKVGSMHLSGILSSCSPCLVAGQGNRCLRCTCTCLSQFCRSNCKKCRRRGRQAHNHAKGHYQGPHHGPRMAPSIPHPHTSYSASVCLWISCVAQRLSQDLTGAVS